MEELAKVILIELEQKMLQTQKIMLGKFADIRTGVANPQILDKITLNYYGVETALKNLSFISVVEGHQIHIKPFDPNLTHDIQKTLLTSNLGITPQNEGQIVKIIFPKPTEEKRKILIKDIHKIEEKTKVIIRNIRRMGNDKIKKIKLNQYLENVFLKQIQELNNKWIKIIEKDTLNKNNELLKI
ncbi:ribosome-recycling factor [Candidatus Phytoplasma phoenicium]|uniref:Ribosome recycling factor n=1 Tax=Candidatus Phytoplasma phoenicium TaxID=198422 RepID=A0A0L0MJW7_9MOLU|nr:ribosome-recycling factor [Candidatus Phytoplasma phoenicium]KND62570.1 Ribosome recycling factor [Candidatus Phytoplasma phoenicium]